MLTKIQRGAQTGGGKIYFMGQLRFQVFLKDLPKSRWFALRQLRTNGCTVPSFKGTAHGELVEPCDN